MVASRYFGRAKTRFQLLMAATVANLTLVATKMGMISPAPGSSHDKPDQLSLVRKPQGRPSLLPNSYWPQPTGSLLASGLRPSLLPNSYWPQPTGSLLASDLTPIRGRSPLVILHAIPSQQGFSAGFLGLFTWRRTRPRSTRHPVAAPLLYRYYHAK